MLWRPVHLGVAERREPAEGAALPAGVGASAAADGGAGARVLLPGHGLPVIGRDGQPSACRHRRAAGVAGRPDARHHERRRQAGRRDPLGTVPGSLAGPYLQPVYDEPEFIIRTVWRRYGGWWDGNPATLKPARERTLATEIARLAGGPAALAARPWNWPARPRAAGATARDLRRPPGTRQLRRACGLPGTWPNWPGWPTPTTPARVARRQDVQHPRRQGHIHDGQRRVPLGRRRSRRQRQSQPGMTGTRNTLPGRAPRPQWCCGCSPLTRQAAADSAQLPCAWRQIAR